MNRTKRSFLWCVEKICLSLNNTSCFIIVKNSKMDQGYTIIENIFLDFSNIIKDCFIPHKCVQVSMGQTEVSNAQMCQPGKER